MVRVDLHSDPDADFRGGGMEIRFVRNPRKPGGHYDVTYLATSAGE